MCQAGTGTLGRLTYISVYTRRIRASVWGHAIKQINFKRHHHYAPKEHVVRYHEDWEPTEQKVDAKKASGSLRCRLCTKFHEQSRRKSAHQCHKNGRSCNTEINENLPKPSHHVARLWHFGRNRICFLRVGIPILPCRKQHDTAK